MPDLPQRRWRPRFSIRTFLILVTFSCAYAACWWPTNERGVVDVRLHRYYAEDTNWPEDMDIGIRAIAAEAVLPLVVHTVELEEEPFPPPQFRYYHRYYLWMFGFVVKLPYEREHEFDRRPRIE